MQFSRAQPENGAGRGGNVENDWVSSQNRRCPPRAIVFQAFNRPTTLLKSLLKSGDEIWRIFAIGRRPLHGCFLSRRGNRHLTVLISPCEDGWRVFTLIIVEIIN